MFDQTPTPPETVTPHSASLLSKWGFGDGDQLDWLAEHGDFDHDKTLCALVRRKLLPALTQKVEVEEISTIHNPIRARTVDGVDVTHLHYDGEWHAEMLTPESVDVPGAEVLAIAREVSANTPAEPRR